MRMTGLLKGLILFIKKKSIKIIFQMITKDQVLEVQKRWGNGVVKIGELKESRIECKAFTNNFLEQLYAFDVGEVLFKPTKCENEQFRSKKSQAMSYFIAGHDRTCDEDKGFAIQPWIKVRFENFGFVLEEKRAISMGNYFFSDANGIEVKVEYTFGYRLVEGNLKIDVHHSSFPFKN
jgi:hypothetical protein